jgi:hypothetical protein
MKRSEYQVYLASREWALLKQELRERASGLCEHCFAAPYQETHHATYERTGYELLEDLLAVCSPCHAFLSGRDSHDPRSQTPCPLQWLPPKPDRPKCAGGDGPADYFLEIFPWSTIYLCRNCLPFVAEGLAFVADSFSRYGQAVR